MSQTADRQRERPNGATAEQRNRQTSQLPNSATAEQRDGQTARTANTRIVK